MIIPEKLSKYVTSTGEYRAAWHDMELGVIEIRKLLALSESQLDDIEKHGLFKDDKKRTCRYITNRPTPLTVDEVIALVTGNFPSNKNKRHNSKTDYKINWDMVEKRGLLQDFPVTISSLVPLSRVEQLPDFHKHFPIHLIQRLSEMSDVQYNNIFERKLIWNPYLNTERFGHDWVKNKEFVHNPNKINVHKSCFGYNRETKRTERFMDSALGYDFWNQIFWLARLSPEKWDKIEKYNLLMFSTYDMVCYMNLDDDVLDKVLRKAMFRHIHYAFSRNVWNVTLKLSILDDLALRKYGDLYENIKHYKKAPLLQRQATLMSLGWGLESDDKVKKELSVELMSKSKCLEVISSFGIHWSEGMSELSLTKQYWKVIAKYHPDKVTESQQ
ncbi:MAG: hypothetical protein J6W79_03375, partial [Alphaproteobacteria bacterium]|nr:hypothetical protein [Alphaproteobacteria bacterium]